MTILPLYPVYLRITLDSETTAFGFNFGISGELPRTGMQIILADNNLATVSPGFLPPGYVGEAALLPTVDAGWWGTGFAGIVSTVPFDRVEINIAPGTQYFFNSFTYGPSPVPEPGTLVLAATGIAGVLRHRRVLKRGR